MVIYINMNKEQAEKVFKSYDKIVNPWVKQGLDLPFVSVKELARGAGIASTLSLASALSKKSLAVIAKNGNGRILTLTTSSEQETKSVTKVARDNAPYKRAVRQADYKSRKPGGGPVVKRRINEESLQRKLTELGAGRLKVGLEVKDKDWEKTEKRDAIKKRLSLRWQNKDSVSQKTVDLPPTLANYIAVANKYDLFSKDGGMTREFRLSPDFFPINYELFKSILELQKIFYGDGGVFKKLRIDPPAIMRIDLGINNEGKLKIFEIEGDKTNGFGYATCADLVRGEEPALPGIAKVLSLLTGKRSLGIPLGQRFYKPEMLALARVLGEYYGIKASCFGREEFARGKFDVILNWPENWQAFPNGQDVLIPQNPMLGDKSFLATLWQQFPEIRNFLPLTQKLQRDNLSLWESTVATNPQDYVVKKTRSSGASGVALTPEDVAIFLKAAAKGDKEEFIVQEKVNQKMLPFSYLDKESRTIKTEPMYTRVEAYLSLLGIATVLTTARPKLPVQGATDSIQIASKINI